ncbi:unnamed protein product [Mucor hiemalis]
MPTVYIIIYSLYHHIYKVALDVQKGLEAEGVTVKLFQVPETLNDDLLEKLHAPERPPIDTITVNDLTKADGFLFGIPTRFGTMPSQLKSFFDATGALWATGALSGKFVGTFFSTASQHGGQETTAYTLLTYFAHHGLNYIPLGFANANLFDNSEVVGGSPYGAGTVANGDGSREPSVKELEIARTQGENFAKILNTYHRGLNLVTAAAPATEETAAVAPVETAVVEDKSEPKVEEVVAPAVATAVAAPAVVAAATKTTEEPVAQKETVAEPAATTSAPVKEEPKAEVKPKVEEKPAAEKSVPKAATKPKEKEKKESKCFCM